MDTAIVVALISLLGSLTGTFGGIYTASKLMVYRIEQLENKVDRFTAIDEKINKLEMYNAIRDERIDNIFDDIKELKLR